MTVATPSEPSLEGSPGGAWRPPVRPTWLLAAALVGSIALWYQTLSPLESPYGIGAGLDRVYNLANSQVVAAGNSPFETFQVGQPQPPGRPHWVFWSAVVALLSGFEPARVPAVYDLLGLATALAWPLAVFLALRPSARSSGFSEWEAAVAAFFAALLASQPIDYTGPFRDPWALTFLLKPNHAASLVLVPLLLRAFARLSTWRGRALMTLAVHLLGWVFVLHQVYFSLGLLAYLLLTWALRRSEARAALLDVGVVLGTGLLVGVLVLGRLLRLGSFLEPSLEVLPAFTPLGLDLTLGGGWIFICALVGAIACVRRPGRLGLLLVGQWLAGYAVAAAYWPASWLELVRSPDEVYYWIRFHTAVLAGIGAMALARLVLPRSIPGLARSERFVSCLLCAALLPHAQPLWWRPERMDAYHRAALDPLPEDLAAVTTFLREETPGDAVVAADPSASILLSALGARRVLLSDVNPPGDQDARRAVVTALLQEPGLATAAKARAAGVTHVVLRAATGQLRAQLPHYFAGAGFERLFLHEARDGASGAAVLRVLDVPSR